MSLVLFIAIACALSMLVVAMAELPQLSRPVAVVAHRAGSAVGPENTLAAIRNAIALGVDYVELDVRATRDGHLVLSHDHSVDRATNGAGAVKDLSFAEIRALDAGIKFGPQYAGEKVPTFDEALNVCRGSVNIYLDHKNAPTAQIIAALKAHGMEGHVVVYVNTEAQQREWKQLDPSIPVMSGLPRDCRRPGGVAEFEARLTAEVLDGDIGEWDAALVQQAHEAGVKVYTDVLGKSDNIEGYREALAMGVDGIQTDHPDRLLAFLNSE